MASPSDPDSPIIIPYKSGRFEIEIQQGTEEQTEEMFHILTDLFAHWGWFDGLEDMDS